MQKFNTDFTDSFKSFFIHQLKARQVEFHSLPSIENPFVGVDMLSRRSEFKSFDLYLGQDQDSIYFASLQFGKNFNESKLTNELKYRFQLSFMLGLVHGIQKHYQELVYQDDVTGLGNQRRLYVDLENMIKFYKNSKKAFSILFIDIDHFKSVNDGHGHLVGSELLLELSDLIKNQLRQKDLAYRYGGDEFVIVLPEVTKHQAYEIANRLLDKIKSHDFILKSGLTKSLSVSIGLASYEKEGVSVREILQLADDLMYSAKKLGRGQVQSLELSCA